MTSDFSINTLLKPQTIAAIRDFRSGTCRLLDPDEIAAAALTPARALTETDVAFWRIAVLDIGSWRFCVKRCALRRTAILALSGAAGSVSIVLSDNCASWLIHGPNDRQGGFYDPIRLQVRDQLKRLFPEYASPYRESMWKAGAIKKLQSGKPTE
jgi:hypothetical protein